MEFYKNTPSSFNEFVDVAMKNGHSEDGFLKNTFKYIFDIDDSEKFGNFYLDYFQHFTGSEYDRMQ